MSINRIDIPKGSIQSSAAESSKFSAVEAQPTKPALLPTQDATTAVANVPGSFSGDAGSITLMAHAPKSAAPKKAVQVEFGRADADFSKGGISLGAVDTGAGEMNFPPVSSVTLRRNLDGEPARAMSLGAHVMVGDYADMG